MMFDAKQTVRWFALEWPGATRVFENLKIDYCCGGHLPLAEACAKAGVETAAVARLLEEARALATKKEVIDLQALSLTELCAYIVDTHHAFTKAESERLAALLEKVCAVHGAHHPELLRIREAFQQMRAELEEHMLKEERVLFPYIMQLERARTGRHRLPPPFGTVQNPIAVMLREHDATNQWLQQMRRWSADYAAPPDACISYQTLYGALEALERDLHEHIHLENNLLFPRALALETEIARGKDPDGPNGR